MRLFIAVDLPEVIKEALEDNIADVRDSGAKGRFSSPENLHVTLAFLGNQEEAALSLIEAAMDEVASAVPAFEVELGDYGMFGRKDKAILWQGFADASDLEELAGALQNKLEAEGVSFDKKPFKAHVTLARRFRASCDLEEKTEDLDGNSSNYEQCICALGDPWVETGTIERISLYRSYLSETGAHYECLYSAHLKAAFEHPEGRLLLIDADACPVTKEALAQARKAKVPVLLVGNATQNLEKHLSLKDPREPGKGFWAATMNVRGGADSADFQIATLAQPGDIVVTQDIGLAAMALGAGAKALGVRGREYTKAAIDAMLLVRHEEKKVRRQGGRTSGPAAFASEDRKRFSRNLARLLSPDSEI